MAYRDGVENARIQSTFLGIGDHDIFTFILYLDYGGTTQGFGTYGLDYKPDIASPRNAFGVHCIKRILAVAGVEKWEDLKGKYVRARVEDGLIRAIGPILGDPDFREDFWFAPGEEYKLFEPKEAASGGSDPPAEGAAAAGDTGQ